MITKLLREAKEELAPDHRTTVFAVRAEQRGNSIVLTGEIQSAGMKRQFLEFLEKKTGIKIIDSIKALPDPELGDKTLGVVTVSVANLRSKPDHPEELATQAYLGTPLTVLKHDDEWYYVQTPDEYLAWIPDNQMVLMNGAEFDGWSAEPKAIVTSDCGWTHLTAEERGSVVSDVVACDILALHADAGSSFEVAYPDGRTGFISKMNAEPFDSWLKTRKETPDEVVETAKRFLGVPYLWGGISSKGVDCSGFTQTVFFLHGILLPRDASQQARVGVLVDTQSGFENLQPGDLLFFAPEPKSRKVTHVAMVLGSRAYIHASGYVRVNSLDPRDPGFSKYRAERFLYARRMLGADPSTGVRRLMGIPYYRAHGH